MNTNAKTIARVERERERESYNLEDRKSIFTYALLNIHARDGWCLSLFVVRKN